MSDRARVIGMRVAYAVPLTPWPVVFWFQTLPDWNGGAHGANALAGIAPAVLPMLLVTSGVGFLLILYFRIIWLDVGVWSVCAVIHFFLLFEYIAAKTWWYA